MFTKPFSDMTLARISQGYHKDHKALDIVGDTTVTKQFITNGYGTPLCAPETCLVLKITGDSFTPNKTKELEHGYGVFLKGLETGYTHLFWHTMPILPVWGGDVVPRGEIVGFMGNSGLVFQNGKWVPVEERLDPDKKGTHLHWEVLENYTLGKRKKFINPLPLINFSWNPNDKSVAAQTKALIAVLKKINKIVSP